MIWRLVEESLSEAAFLWGRLDRTLEASDHTLEDAERWVQERLFGALDGVQLAADAAAKSLLAEALTESDVDYVSVAVYLLAKLRTPEATRVLEVHLSKLTPNQMGAVVSGFRRTGDAELLLELRARLGGEQAVADAALIEALTQCGAPVDLDWRACLQADEPALRHAAASALREQPADKRTELMWLALQSPDPEVQTRALVAGVLAGDGGAWRRCVDRLRTPDKTSGPLLCLAAMLGADAERALVIEAIAHPDLSADALWALGFAGTRAAVDACIAHSRGGAAHAAHAAIDTISWVTGADLSQHVQAGAALTSPPSGAPDGLEAWWSRERERFSPTTRYQQGKPVTLATLRQTLESGPARRRRAVAAELSARTRGACRVQTWAFCSEQRKQLTKVDALDIRQLRSTAKAVGFALLEES